MITKLGLKPTATTDGNQLYESTKVIELLGKQNAEKESKKESKKDGSGKGSKTKISDSKPLNKPVQKTIQLSEINEQVDEPEGVVDIPDLDGNQEDGFQGHRQCKPREEGKGDTASSRQGPKGGKKRHKK